MLMLFTHLILYFSKQMDFELFHDLFLLSSVPKVTNQSSPQELAKYITVGEIYQTWSNINNKYCADVNQHRVFSQKQFKDLLQSKVVCMWQ